MKKRNKISIIIFMIFSFLITNFYQANVNALTEDEIKFTRCTWNGQKTFSNGYFDADGDQLENISYDVTISVGKSANKDNGEWKDSSDLTSSRLEWYFSYDYSDYRSNGSIPTESNFYKYFDGTKNYNQCKKIYVVIDDSSRITTDFYEFVTITETKPTNTDTYLEIVPQILVSADATTWVNYQNIDDSAESIIFDETNPCVNIPNGCYLYTTDNKRADIFFRTDLYSVCRSYIKIDGVEHELDNSTSPAFQSGSCPSPSEYVITHNGIGYHLSSVEAADENNGENNDNSDNENINYGDPVEATCEGILGPELINEISKIFTWIRIIAPILVIVLGSVDFAKAILSDDQQELKKAGGKFIKRCIVAVAIFFIPSLIMFLISFIDKIADVSCDIRLW